MESRNFIEREERKYEVGIRVCDLNTLVHDLSRYAPVHEFTTGQQITYVSSVYFDNKDYDLLRLSLLTQHHTFHVRLRTYEYEDSNLEQSECFWMEVNIKKENLRKKKRFMIKRKTLLDVLPGKDVAEMVVDYNDEVADPETIRSLFWETQDTILQMGLKPTLLVTYKRLGFQKENQRLCLDWDIHYYHVGADIYHYPSWKNISRAPTGKVAHIILELKYPQGCFPAWIADLQRRYAIEEKNYSKFVEGMGFLFQGPLRHHREGNSFLQMIEAYLGDRKHPLR